MLKRCKIYTKKHIAPAVYVHHLWDMRVHASPRSSFSLCSLPCGFEIGGVKMPWMVCSSFSSWSICWEWKIWRQEFIFARINMYGRLGWCTKKAECSVMLLLYLWQLAQSSSESSHWRQVPRLLGTRLHLDTLDMAADFSHLFIEMANEIWFMCLWKENG